MILGGIVVGPQVLGWAEPDSIELVSNVGLGFLFLLAGYELELGLFRERAGRLAIRSWLVTALVADRGDRRRWRRSGSCRRSSRSRSV